MEISGAHYTRPKMGNTVTRGDRGSLHEDFFFSRRSVALSLSMMEWGQKSTPLGPSLAVTSEHRRRVDNIQDNVAKSTNINWSPRNAVTHSLGPKHAADSCDRNYSIFLLFLRFYPETELTLQEVSKVQNST